MSKDRDYLDHILECLEVHDYPAINFERIWEIVERDLPPLQAAIEAMRKEIKE